MNRLLRPPCNKAVSAPTQCQTHSSDRILFAEDDVGVRDAMARVLIRSGYHVDVAEDGAAGWEALQIARYDLLITDNKMPKLTGVELVRKLRSAHMKLPVILASASLPTEESGQNPRLQFAATLLKPFTIDELLETVKAVLSATAMESSARNFAFPVQAEVVIPVESLGRWRSQSRSGAAQ
jgi:DNA-binding response OmpR family regulator